MELERERREVEVSIVELSGSRDELTQNVDIVSYVRTSNPKVHKAPNKVVIMTRI